MSDTTAVAAVDCGTNSTRLLVVTTAGEVAAREMRITRLGAGVDAARQLQPEAIARTLDVLREYRAIMDVERVTGARLVATSAVR
ncbi:MAG TPA: exopolyphosphatase, partial [Acidimicrobiales bacterium]|nr:exopolyphosphatase [Acidimicrobiales bacterium]